VFIRWHGYSCFEFADSNHRVVVDPHDGKSIGIWPPAASADIVLSSHNSYDRNAFRAIKGNHKDFLAVIGYFNERGFCFHALPSFSDQCYGAERGANSIYMFVMDGIRIACAGCLGDIPVPEVLAQLHHADILFVPVGEYGTMPMAQVNTFVRMVDAKVVVPTDFRIGGITLPLSPLAAFTRGRNADDFVHVGNEMELLADDLTDFTGYWIFDR